MSEYPQSSKKVCIYYMIPLYAHIPIKAYQTNTLNIACCVASAGLKCEY